MANYDMNFYEGANYSLSPSYKFDQPSNSPYVGFNLPASAFGLTTDPRTANQIGAISSKLNTGTKIVEVTGILNDVLEYIPKQHFKEMERLKKLAGVELTFHGPLVEPSGVTDQGWNPVQREIAERQMVNALDRAHDLDPHGNIVVTFHSSNGLPEPETKILVKRDGKEVEEIEQVIGINEREGRLFPIPKRIAESEFDKGIVPMAKDKPQQEAWLDKINERRWSQQTSAISLESERSLRALREVEESGKALERAGLEPLKVEALAKYYKTFEQKPQEFQQQIETLKEVDPKAAERLRDYMTGLSFSKQYAEDAYQNLKGVYDSAYTAAKENNNHAELKKLEEFKNSVAKSLHNYSNDPEKLKEFAEKVAEGATLLSSISAPQELKTLKGFAMAKASETFSNVAYTTYQKYGKDNSTPVISIENPPVGSGLSRAEDLKELVELSRKKFANRLVNEQKLSEKEAMQKAEKIIGVTWDVGHINMLRKHGYGDEKLKQQTKEIAPYVKHVHLSDNFGLEHTELPMGMGNVPIKEHEEILKKQFGAKFKEIKQIVETGGWYQHFKTSPLAETLEAFGSPVYPMKMNSYWNASRGAGAGYFAGYGRFLPDTHFSTYGAGFSTLPPELGGQMSGRSRVSGTPTE